MKERTGSDLPAHSRKIAALTILGGASLTAGVYLATLAHHRPSSRPTARRRRPVILASGGLLGWWRRRQLSRFRLATSPTLTGSTDTPKTIGMVAVAALAATAEGVPLVAITAT